MLGTCDHSVHIHKLSLNNSATMATDRHRRTTDLTQNSSCKKYMLPSILGRWCNFPTDAKKRLFTNQWWELELKAFYKSMVRTWVRYVRYDSYKIIFHQGLIFKEKKELPIQTETSRTLDLSFKIRIKLVKFSYSSELTFFIFRFPQSSSCIWNEIKVNHLAEKDKWVFSLILIKFLNIQLFHPSFHNIHYLYIIKFRLTKIKSSCLFNKVLHLLFNSA